MESQDSIWIQKLKENNKAVFEEIFHLYFPLMYRYAHKFIPDTDEATEVVQDVFIKFWNKSGTLPNHSNVKAYLFRAVYHACLNYLKHLKVRDQYKEYVLRQMETHFQERDWESEEEMYRMIEEGIASLPPQCQKIFIMSRKEGKKYQEIADILGLSIKTVEVQMGKAFKILRKKAEKWIV